MRLLTEMEVRGLKPREVRYMVCDGNGLYVEVVPAGHKYFWLRFMLNGKQRKVLLGRYPELSLKSARTEAVLKRRDFSIASGRVAGDVCFKDFALIWHKEKMSDRTKEYADTVLSRLALYVFPSIGSASMREIRPSDVFRICRSIEDSGYVETAHRVLSTVGHIFRYGIVKDVCENDVTKDLSGSLTPVRSVHFARLTRPEDIGRLMNLIFYYPYPRVRNALYLSAYTFCRPGEVRAARWSEIDFDKKEWEIPAERMKMRRPHLVPLSRQSLAVLSSQKTYLDACDSDSEFVFPSERGGGHCMSENTVRLALRSMGYSATEMSAHGFRGMASTYLNESRLWAADVIERQLAHFPEDSVRETYNEAQYLPDRVKMMQWYADELDRLRDMAANRS